MSLQSHNPPVKESSPRPGPLVPPPSGHGPSPVNLDWPSDADLLTALGPWLYERRWFPLKGEGVPTPDSISIIADHELAPTVRDLLIAIAPALPTTSNEHRSIGTVGAREDTRVDNAPLGAAAPILLHVPLVLEHADALASFATPGEPAAAAGFALPVPPTVDASARPVEVSASPEVGRGVALVDGVHHPAFWAAWAEAAQLSGSVLDEADARAIVERSGAVQVMTGEQSNTNVVMRAPADAATPDLVVKLFRVLSPGPNPDVELSLALAAKGWDRVRRPVAWSTLSWVDPSSGEQVSAHSAMACEFIPAAEDGFELFCALAAQDAAEDMAQDTVECGAAGTATSDSEKSRAIVNAVPGSARHRAISLARDLGLTTAQMHSILAQACGEHEPASPSRFVDALRERAAWALAEAPDLRWRIVGIEGKIERIYARLEACDHLEPATRIHGDYHLGQVLREKVAGEVAGSEGDSDRWFVLDFEGEPLRPLAQRLLPDQPMRDVAGMLRSFNYAAAVGAPGAASAWLSAVRAAFLEGYEAERPTASSETVTPGGADGSASLTTVAGRRYALINALELDKALYEAVYEAHNRPGWVEIPLRGIEALLA